MLMTYLGLDYDIEVQADPRKAPKGKLPYLIADGRKIADSELIVEYLNGVTEGRVYAGLSAKGSRPWAGASRLVDDHLYWIFVAAVGWTRIGFQTSSRDFSI